MASVVAYAMHAVSLRDATGKKIMVPASTAAAPSIFEVDETTFKRLEALNAARLPTEAEVAVSKVKNESVSVVVAAPAEETQAPASGADGDPQGRPKAAKKQAVKAEEEI